MQIEFKEKTGKELLNEYCRTFTENFDIQQLDNYLSKLSIQYKEIEPIVNKWKDLEPSKQQEQIIEERYLWKEYNETWKMLSRRVQRTISTQLIPYFEYSLNNGIDSRNKYNFERFIQTIENIFFNIIDSRIQLPNTPTLVNQGITIYRKQNNLEREKYLLYSDKLSFDEYKELYEVLDRTYQLSQCNVLSIEDSMEGILETFNKQTLISKQGGGIGLNFGFLRPKNQDLSNGGKSSGSVSFIDMFDSMLKTIKQGGKNRRGQGMQTHGFGNLKNKYFWKEEFSIHPDQIDFITQKKDNNGQTKLSNFNISFVINNTKSFIKKLENNEYVSQVFNNNVYIKDYIRTNELFDLLSSNQWKTGDPGLVFLDKINKYNPLQNVNLNITSTNVCGEIPILSDFDNKIIGNCNLISIDLFKFVNVNNIIIDKPSLEEIFNSNKFINWNQLKSMVKIQYEFLDLLIDLLMFPVDDNNRGSMLLRNIGIGITSLQGLLSWLNIPYNSEDGRILQMNLMTIQEVEGFKQSIEKQKVFGNYLLFDISDKKVLPNYLFTHINEIINPFVDMLKVYSKDEINNLVSQLYEFRRNIYVTTVQPSGTVGILMQTEKYGDTGQGIEPFFSLFYIRKYRIPNTDNEWKTLEYMNKLLEFKLDQLEIKDKSHILHELKQGGKISHIEHIPDTIKKQFLTSMEIDYLDHIKMLEQIQVSNSQQISKTINMVKDQTVDDVKKQYLYQIKSPVIKGITIYRDGSLETQVLVSNTSQNNKDKQSEKSVEHEHKEHKENNINPQLLNKNINFIFLNEKNKIVPKPRKETLKSVTRKVKTDDGTLYITMSFDDKDDVTEVFLSNGNEIQEILGRLISLQLRSGVDLDVILEQLSKVRNGKYSKLVLESFKTMINDQYQLGIINSNKIVSVISEDDSDIIKINEENKEHQGNPVLVKIDDLEIVNGIYYDKEGNHYCPSCLSKNSIIKGEGCQSCSTCGWSKCS